MNSKNILALPISLLSTTLMASPTPQELEACIDSELNKIKTIREETISVFARAPEGRGLACRTKEDIKTATGKGANSNEKVLSKACKLTGAGKSHRTAILACDIKNNKPVITGKVWGKGCEFENSASWEMKVTYIRTPDVSDYKSAMNKCLSR